jgi:hypothetical protein
MTTPTENKTTFPVQNKPFLNRSERDSDQVRRSIQLYWPQTSVTLFAWCGGLGTAAE